MPKQDRYCLDCPSHPVARPPCLRRGRVCRGSKAIHGRPCLRCLGFHVAPEAAAAGPDMHESAVVPGGQRRAARLINDIVIGEETDIDPDGSYVSHLDLYLRAMIDVGASTRQFDAFRSMGQGGVSVEAAMVRTGVPSHVQAFVAHTMTLARSGSTEEVLAAFFYGREDIIPEMFSRLQKTLPGAQARQRSLASFRLLHRSAHRTRWG